MKKFLLASLAALAISSSVAFAADAISALDAVKIADKELNKEAKDRVISIFGEKSSDGVFPDKWQIIFFDPYAKQDGRMIEITSGRVTAIKDGYTELGDFRLAAYKPEEIINLSRVKVDSSKLADILKTSTALKDTHISNLEISLVKPDKDNVSPVWKLVVYASNNMTGKSDKVGTATISAENGQILNLDINLKRLQ